MSFTSGIPQTGQTLGQTRDDVRNNFLNYYNTMSVNHVPPNGALGFSQGKHTFCEFVTQTQSPATITNEVAAYCRSISATPQLCFQQQNKPAADPDIQMTRFDVGVTNALNGWSWLPGGLIIQWGTDQFAGTATAKVVTFPLVFPATCFNISLTGILFNNVFDTSLPSASTSQFTASRSLGGIQSNQQFCWTAIGN